jgi:hypothetical protein
MTWTIIQILIGFLLLFEVGWRLFLWTYPTDFTYRICRPFGIPFSMKIGVIITFAETLLGVVLAYRGIMEII